MFGRIRTHLSYANVAATMALVFALTGGAVAASSHSGGSNGNSFIKASASVASTQAHAVVAKKKSSSKGGARGPAGPKGATGAAGPAGPAGPTGATGATGAAGPAGSAGVAGANGEKGEKGETGPAGAAGETGPEGVCSTTDCTLPVGASETGTWITHAEAPEGSSVGSTAFAPISFPIRLPKPIVIGKAYHFTQAQTEKEEFEVGGKPTGCKLANKNVEEPEATIKGTLCIFTAESEETSWPDAWKYEDMNSPNYSNVDAAGPTGTVMLFGENNDKEALNVLARGTWAVTAE
jgi:hypothetical protein